MAIDTTLKDELYDNGIYEAWQFVVNTSKLLSTAKYCEETILRLLSTMHQENEAWKEALWNELMSQDSKVKQLTVTTDCLPEHMTSIVGEQVSNHFLLNKLVKDFFQYSRNVFDSISQIANVALLGVQSKRIDRVDFPVMFDTFTKVPYCQEFPSVSAWYTATSTNPAYQYIDAFNNRTKHTCDVYLKVSMDLLGNNDVADINPFFRKDVQHDRQDIGTYLSQIFNFVQQSFDGFLVELKKEYSKKLHLDNRYNKLGVWQQKMKETPDSDFSAVYIKSGIDFSAMPDEISILLLNRTEDGEIHSKNCSIDTILVKKEGSEQEYIGRYIASEPCGDDTLLRYRKYRKDNLPEHAALITTCLEQAEKKKFYCINPFMDITTVSDDENFIARVQLGI